MRALIVHPPDGRSTVATILGHPVGFSLATLNASVPQPSEEEVLVRVTAFSLNYRDRAWIRDRASQPSLPPTDRAIGSEFAGVVIATGTGVEGFGPGDRVMADMAWPSNGIQGLLGGVPTNAASREFQCFHFGKLNLIPESMPDDVAAAFVLGAYTAHSLVRRIEINAGDHVLMTAAASNTSLLATQVLRSLGVSVSGLTRRESTLERLLELGYDRVFLASECEDRTSPLNGFARELRGFRAVVDPFADSYLESVVHLLGFAGRYVTCGVADQATTGPAQRTDFGLDRLLNLLIVKNLRLSGSCLGLPCDLDAAVKAYTQGDFAPILDSTHFSDDLAGFVSRSFAPERIGKVVCMYSQSRGGH